MTVNEIVFYTSGSGGDGSKLYAKFDTAPTSETDYDILVGKGFPSFTNIIPDTPVVAKKIYVWGFGGPYSNTSGLTIYWQDGTQTFISNFKTADTALLYNQAEEAEFSQNVDKLQFYGCSDD